MCDKSRWSLHPKFKFNFNFFSSICLKIQSKHLPLKGYMRHPLRVFAWKFKRMSGFYIVGNSLIMRQQGILDILVQVISKINCGNRRTMQAVLEKYWIWFCGFHWVSFFFFFFASLSLKNIWFDFEVMEHIFLKLYIKLLKNL